MHGPLWQGRYKARVVGDEGYLQQLVAYVLLNPVRAGLVDDPAEHRWSGHGEIVGRHRHGLVDVDEVLLMYGDDRRKARRAYSRSLKITDTSAWIGEEPGRLPWWQAGEDMPVSPRAGRVYVDYLGRTTAP